ncbi:MAG: Gfo/Idh/MocA family oxidoreductase [Verrucomicrobiales bacterium]|nr:Gfo/Idh/MocA family oxidoreductase [Verrucomicrobiales bacterium]
MKKNSQITSSRRKFLKATAGSALAFPFIGWKTAARGAGPNDTVHLASFGAGGRAWADLKEFSKHPSVKVVALTDLDASRALNARKAFPAAKFYGDWKEMLDKEGKNFICAGVGTPDHMHAPMAMSAMQLGKHVYCQKPLTRTLHEARALREYAAANNIVTQMGTQVASSAGNQTAAAWLQKKLIGDVISVHSMNPKSWGSMDPLPKRKDEIPAGLNWDAWIAGAPMRDYIKGEYHPSQWRKRLDFGTGTLGDMGCHIYHPWFMGLNTPTPLSVKSLGPGPVDGDSWPINSKVEYEFAGNDLSGGKPFMFTWYDGNQKTPVEVATAVGGEMNIPRSGSVVIGTDGAMAIPHGGGGIPRLFSDSKFEKAEIEQIPAGNHFNDWIDVIKSGEGKPLSNFAYSGPMSEAVLLGTVATRLPGEKLLWDDAAAKFTNSDPANALAKGYDYRKGWEVKGL